MSFGVGVVVVVSGRLAAAGTASEALTFAALIVGLLLSRTRGRSGTYGSAGAREIFTSGDIWTRATAATACRCPLLACRMTSTRRIPRSGPVAYNAWTARESGSEERFEILCFFCSVSEDRSGQIAPHLVGDSSLGTVHSAPRLLVTLRPAEVSTRRCMCHPVARRSRVYLHPHGPRAGNCHEQADQDQRPLPCSRRIQPAQLGQEVEEHGLEETGDWAGAQGTSVDCIAQARWAPRRD